MLKRLHISNFALIEGVKVNFPVNLCVVTGETGAGKSIFLEALSLVLGARADVGVLQDKTKHHYSWQQVRMAKIESIKFFVVQKFHW
jgi:DNA repair ATPase RecN